MTTTACLIVRNEAAVIERCLDSLLPLVDQAIIVDTGSTDNTIELCKNHPMPAKIIERPWVNFAHNRTELMGCAHARADWLLLVDADHEVAVTGARPDLDEADAWLVEHNTAWRYSIPRVVRGNIWWRYEGATHEYLTADQPFHRAATDWLTINDHADGGSRGDKFERDLRLLADAYADNPDDARTVFYLARTCEDLGRWPDALMWYRRRAEMGGWEEERWWAQYRAAWMRAYTDPMHALAELWVAWESRPSRNEPLARIMELAHMNRWWRISAAASAQLRNTPPDDDLLFVETSAYPNR